MGILNVTPDSFSDGGKFISLPKAIDRAVQMEADGADIIDIGAESTRPGAQAISVEEEKRRISPVLDEVLRKVKVPVSIDTTKFQVAEHALACGAAIINDVSALSADERIASLASAYGAGLLLMHRRGTADNMQELAEYRDVVSEVVEELWTSVRKAVNLGVSINQIAIDPGIGFSKRAEHNWELLRSITSFYSFERPVVLGISRKSFIGSLINEGDPEKRVDASAALSAVMAYEGVHVIRTHDVKKTKQAILIAQEMKRERSFEVGKY